MKTLSLILLLTCLSSSAQTNVVTTNSILSVRFSWYFPIRATTTDMVFIASESTNGVIFSVASNMSYSIESNVDGIYWVDIPTTNPYEYFTVAASNSAGISPAASGVWTPPPPPMFLHVTWPYYGQPFWPTNNYGTNIIVSTNNLLPP